jgi:hypothetical protein
VVRTDASAKRNVGQFEAFLKNAAADYALSKVRLQGTNPCAKEFKLRGFRRRLSILIGGAERDRTADLLNAIQALSQLSYSPTVPRDDLSLKRKLSAGSTWSFAETRLTPRRADRGALQTRARSISSRAARRNLSVTSAPPSIRAISSIPSACARALTRLRVAPRRSSFSTKK